MVWSGLKWFGSASFPNVWIEITTTRVLRKPMRGSSAVRNGPDAYRRRSAAKLRHRGHKSVGDFGNLLVHEGRITLYHEEDGCNRGLKSLW